MGIWKLNFYGPLKPQICSYMTTWWAEYRFSIQKSMIFECRFDLSLCMVIYKVYRTYIGKCQTHMLFLTAALTAIILSNNISANKISYFAHSSSKFKFRGDQKSCNIAWLTTNTKFRVVSGHYVLFPKSRLNPLKMQGYDFLIIGNFRWILY